MALRVCTSRPRVGSSRNSTFGWCRRPRAISSRRFMPPENVMTSDVRRSVRSTMLRTWSARALKMSRGMSYSIAWNWRFSSAVRRMSSDGSWNTRPMERRTSFGCVRTSWPANVARPPVGLSSVARILMVVDLPAPFGPRNPKISRPPTLKVTPSTAVRSPNFLERLSTSMIAGRGGTRLINVQFTIQNSK